MRSSVMGVLRVRWVGAGPGCELVGALASGVWWRASRRGWFGRGSRCRRWWGCTRRWVRCLGWSGRGTAGLYGVFCVAGLVEDGVGGVGEGCGDRQGDCCGGLLVSG